MAARRRLKRVLQVFRFIALAASLGSPASAETLHDRDFDCLVDARTRVKLGAAVAGVIEKISVDRGDRVKKGQVLVELDSRVETAQLQVARAHAATDQPVDAARAKQDLAHRNAERMRQLRQSNPGALTGPQYDEAISNEAVGAFNLRDAELSLKAAALEADRAEALLEQRRIVSPIDGLVVERQMSTGEYRNDQQSFLTLAELDPLNVEVYLPVAYYGQTATGAVAAVTLQSPLGTTRNATVEIVDRVLDASSGTFGVRLTLPNPNLLIPAGLRCKVRF